MTAVEVASPKLPRVTREYVNHHLDSRRWRIFTPREGDIVVTTSYKSGTTWTQQILHALVFQGDPAAPSAPQASPWIDAAFMMPLDELAQALEAQRHRRFVKSHLPLDGLPWYPEVKYLVVGRDARDVFMSLWNHYRSYTPFAMARFREVAPPGDETFPDADFEVRDLFRQWISRGWFPWESEGWPFWSNLHHTQSYWDHRLLPNLLFVHYADMLADPHAEIRRIAAFLDVPLTDAALESTVAATSFASMKARFREEGDPLLGSVFRGGTDSFIHKGTNGRWRDVLGAEELALYEAAKQRVLTPGCAGWLEGGRRAVDPRGAAAQGGAGSQS